MAAERRGKIPPQAIMMLSTICEMRWIVLWTKIMFSLLLTKSMTDLVEWLQRGGGKEPDYYGYKHLLQIKSLQITNINRINKHSTIK